MIIVTGAAGAIGSRLVARLVETYGENSVVAVSREPVDIPGAINHVHDLTKPLHTTLLDISHDVEGIVHLAAVHNVGDSIRNPEFYYQNNVAMTNNLLGYAISQNARWFILASTGMVYAQQQDPMPSKESDLLDPGNPYALSKSLCENIVYQVSRHHSFASAIFRIFNVATPVPLEDTQRSRFLIPSLVRSAASGTGFSLLVNNKKNNETLIRDYIHVEDVVSGLMQGIGHFKSNSFFEFQTNNASAQLDLFYREPKIFNLSTGVATSVLHLVDLVQEITGKKIPITISNAEHWEGYFVGSNELARTQLGWKPQYSLEDMIKQQWRMIK